MSKAKEPVIDYDGRWKSLIETLFEHFVDFFLSDIYDDINFTIPPVFLKQDASKIVASKRKKGDLVVDCLVKVRLKDGTDKILVIHIEIQGYKNIDYGKKMYQSFCRIDHETEGMDVTSFVLYVADKIPKNHDHYEYKFGRTKIRFEFPVYLIKNQNEQALLQSDNPFTIAVLVCLRILNIRERNKGKKKQEYLERIELRKEILELIRARFERLNYTKDIIVSLVDFALTITVIPDDMEAAFEKEFYQPYILKHSDMELSIQGRKYANMLGKAHFGNSFDEIVAKWKEALREKEEAFKQKEEERKLREEERKLREEAFKQKEEERKLREEALQQKEEERKLREEALQQKEEAQQKLETQQHNLIINLRFEAHFELSKIAELLELEMSKVEQVIKTHQEKEAKNK